MQALRVLVVGQDQGTVKDLAASAETCGAALAGTADSARAAESQLRACDVLVVDQTGLDAEEVAELMRAANASVPAVLPIVGVRGGTIDDAVVLMRRGAFAVVSLPAANEALSLHLGHAASQRELLARNAELERSLESHERLAMIGKLAAGVAHELNNPLDGVLRYVNFAIAKLPQEAEQVTYLLHARQGLRRMADIVRDLLQFSRNANVDAADEDAERLARDAVEQTVAASGRKVETTYVFPAGGIHVPRAVFQVLGNLAKNAVDAMPRGGRLTVGATVASGRVRIAVTDTGTGIPDEIRERIFEPFFTTKEVGKGTGLGLSISQRIVERLGGTMTLESEVGRGTTVYVEVPVRPSSAHTAQAVAAARAARAVRPLETAGAAKRTQGVF